MKIICLDTETTGLKEKQDEILQLSIIDGDGVVLFHEYFKPVKNSSWYDAQQIHGISPDDVKNSRPMLFFKDRIQQILKSADIIVGYNISGFDLPMLFANGIENDVKDGSVMVDVMEAFAPIYGEWNDRYCSFRYQKLSTCAEYYNYGGTDWHDALDDAKAALFCFYSIFGNPPIIPENGCGIRPSKIRSVPDYEKPFEQRKAEYRQQQNAKYGKQKKLLTRKKCYIYAFLWFFFSCGLFFPVSIYYIWKSNKLPK